MSISKCIFSFLLFLFSQTILAQETKNDSIITPLKTERYGLRLGIDASKLARSFIQEDYRGLEVVGDYRLTKKYYLAGEIGNEKRTIDEDRVNFTISGTYFKVGFDYNSYENWLDMENLIYVGMRFGTSTFSKELNTYRVYNPNPYFGESPTIASGRKFDGLSAQWIEIVAGVKAELFSNFYAGFNFRINYLVGNKEPNDFENLYIPGFNKKYEGKFGVGFNYTLSYFIPLYKKKLQPTSEGTKK
ncbi:DUF6048 family protein [Flavobacterium lacus]|nr:DUF6048 family protein [Flavobacterium lacus]